MGTLVRSGLAAAIALTIALGGFWLGRENPLSQAGSPDSEPANVGAEAQRAYAQVAPIAQAYAPGNNTTADSDHDHSEASLQAQRKQFTDVNENRWSSDQPGSSDAARLEQDIRSVTSSAGMQGLVFQPDNVVPECRRQMCRIEASFPAGASSGQWITRMLIDMGTAFGNINNVTIPLPGGETREVIYAYRTGIRAPSPVAGSTNDR